jgi:phosphoribosyl 1,2-cyclic phosphodiesterase
MPPSSALRFTCWGTRGSIATPGPQTVRYGGNTACVEVRGPGGGLYLLDAGTGLRRFSRRLEADGGAPLTAELFISHFHWDHIQGFPFFGALYREGSRLRVHGPRLGTLRVQDALACQMSRSYFPVPIEAVAADLEFGEVSGDGWTDGDVRVTAAPVRHPGGAVAYRVDAGAASVAYVPDNELGDAEGRDAGDYAALVTFLSGAGVLIHDAMFTADEYPSREGWGHSTAAQAAQLAVDAGVGRLLLFHHDPDRTDDQVDEIVAGLRCDLRRGGSALEVSGAVEGEEVAVAGEDAP